MKCLKTTENIHTKSLLPTGQLYYTSLFTYVSDSRGHLNIHPN